MCLYSSRGACSLRGTCAKKRNNTVCVCMLYFLTLFLLWQLFISQYFNSVHHFSIMWWWCHVIPVAKHITCLALYYDGLYHTVSHDILLHTHYMHMISYYVICDRNLKQMSLFLSKIMWSYENTGLLFVSCDGWVQKTKNGILQITE